MGPLTQGVAEEIAGGLSNGRDDRGAHEFSRGRKVGPHGVRGSMTRQVDADEGVPGGQGVAEGAPQTRRLGKPVQQHQGRPVTAQFDMEGHVR
jgi:hypothetical protein